ncbi:MAG: glycosyltransferase family 2 protein [Isosphaeraceae bacterium]
MLTQEFHAVDLTLVIVSYNTRGLLRACLASVARHAPTAQVVVVDNNSKDGSPEMVEADFPAVELIRMGRNAGFAAANNAGIERSRGAFVVLLNSDTVLEDDALDRCARWMESRPEVGATSPRLIGADGQAQQCVYPFPTLAGLARTAARRPPAPESALDDAPGWLAGTALMIRREALQAVGGRLDEGFWMYWEDCDLSARLLAAGWRLQPFEAGWVRHHGGASGGGLDSNRRADLHAWYVFGKHRWFAKHRPKREAVALWLLDALDVVRKSLRGTFRAGRSGERTHARVMAAVLAERLFGRRPRVPGASRP